MSEFDKIIKEKVEQFEVPYNDAHWAEMDAKLDTIKAAKLKTNIFSAAAVIAILSIGAYLIFGGEPTNNQTSPISHNNNAIENKTNIDVINNTVENTNNSKTTNTHTQENKNQTENSKTLENVNTIEGTKVLSEITDNTTNNPVIDRNSTSLSNNSSTNVNAEFIVYNNRVCMGNVVTFESMDNDRPVSYLWNFGDGQISREPNPKHQYKNDGVYDVTLTLIDKQSGTEHTTIQRNIVTILTNPKANFTYIEDATKHDDNKLQYPYTIFKIKNPTKENTYEWDFGNGESSKGTIVKTIHKNASNYIVKLNIKNNNGCVSQIEKNIEIKNNFALYAANGLRQNPDNPENGIFMPKALLEWDIPFEMTITDKTGKTIYKTSDKNEGWNGTINNSGQQLNEGIYFWKITTKDAENNSHYHHGEIKLIK